MRCFFIPLANSKKQPTERSADGETAIFVAAMNNQLLALDELVVAAVSQQLEIDESGSHGWTPLHAACKSGSVGCLLVLLSTKLVGLNSRALDGSTPLHVAASNGTYSSLLPFCG